MTTVSIRDAKNKLTELARRVEGGETIIVTRHGKPVLNLVPHKAKEAGGIDWGALDAFTKQHGVTKIFIDIADDFDDPLPEDFLLQPLPPET